jgi:hypothetical protein
MHPKHFTLAALAGALTLFGWETVSNAALPWHMATMRTFADSTAAVQAIRAHAPENGLYVDGRGVVAAVSFMPDMTDKSSLIGPMMGKQIVLDLAVAFVFLFGMTRLPRATTKQYALGSRSRRWRRTGTGGVIPPRGLRFRWWTEPSDSP